MLYIDGKIKYMHVSGISVIEEWAPGSKREPFLEKWDEFIEQQNEFAKTSAPSLKTIRQTGPWPSIPVEIAFVSSAF